MPNKSILLVLTSAFLLIGCTDGQENRLRARQNALDVDSFSFTTDLEETKEIHTSRQAEYLSYDGNYQTIPEANYPDGQQHLSDPEPINLAWNFTAPSGKSISRYDVIIGKEADLSDGYTVTGTSASSLDVYNSYLGDNYFRVVANYTDGTSDSSKIQKYQVNETYPRNLKIDGMTNCRDMGGGRTLEDGGQIKQGLIFRTSSTNSWAYGRGAVPDTITDAGKKELLGHLGCKTEINVNNGGNTNSIGIQNFVDANMWYDGGKHHLYRNAEPLKRVFHALSDINNYPVFYHCRIGTDRTGLVAIVLSGLLGVPENLIYQDYLFSNFGNIQEKRYIGDKAGRDNILNYINDLKTFPGERFQNKVYNYLLAIGVPASELNSVIDILTEGTKAQGNDNHQEVVMADAFEPLDGATKQTYTGTTRQHPVSYFTLGAGQTVSAEFSPKYSGQAKLVAYLGSANSDSALKVADSISVTMDGQDIEVDESITFASAGFGNGDNRTYYAAVMLADVDVVAGGTPVTITGIANDLNIAAISLIPTEEVNEQPDNPQPAGKKGCGGSIMAVSSMFSLLALASGFIMVGIKKRKED